MKDIVLKSDRNFGIEIEVGNNDYENYQRGALKVCEFLPFKSVYDGSIKGFDLATEFVSDILQGNEGLKYIKEAVNTLTKYGFKVNESTGFHLHLDVSSLVSAENYDIVKITDLYEKYQGQKIKKVVIISNHLVKQLNSKQKIQQIVKKSSHYFEDYSFYSEMGKVIKREKIPQLKFKRLNIKEYTFLVPHSKIDRKKAEEFNRTDNKIRSDYRKVSYTNDIRVIDIQDSQIEEIITKYQNWLSRERFIKEKELFESVVVSDDYYAIVETEGVDNSIKLKQLFAFYVVFNDVLSGFVPKSRRNNKYCQALSKKYSLNEVLNIKSYEDFDKVWYKVHNPVIVKTLKGNKYHESRYYYINFHSLSKQPTIEIRSHSGTLNYRKIARWIYLHQTIFDKVENDVNFSEFIRNIATITDIDKKTEEFYKYLNLDKDVENELRLRMMKFNEIK
jgi:hypothetical protein